MCIAVWYKRIMPSTDFNLNVRLPERMNRRLEAELALRGERGLRLTKSDIVREALDLLLVNVAAEEPDAASQAG